MSDNLREVRIFRINDAPFNGWFHRWVERDILQKVPGYEDKEGGFVAMERVRKVQGLVERKDGSMTYVDPGSINFSNQPE